MAKKHVLIVGNEDGVGICIVESPGTTTTNQKARTWNSTASKLPNELELDSTVLAVAGVESFYNAVETAVKITGERRDRIPPLEGHVILMYHDILKDGTGQLMMRSQVEIKEMIALIDSLDEMAAKQNKEKVTPTTSLKMKQKLLSIHDKYVTFIVYMWLEPQDSEKKEVYVKRVFSTRPKN